MRAVAAAKTTDSKAGLDLVRFLAASKGADAAREELQTRIKAGGDVFDYQMMLIDLDFASAKSAEASDLLQNLAGSANTPDRKLAAQVKLAESFVRKTNFSAAEPIIAEILQQDRRNVGALRLRAAIRIDQGQLDNAIADLREALNDQPKSTDLLLLMAVAYERAGKNELADRQYADALKASGFDPRVGSRYVAFLQRRGDVARAEDILTELSGRNPRNIDILSSLAQLKLSRQNWNGALSVADTVERVSNNKAISEQIRGAALAGQNKPDASVMRWNGRMQPHLMPFNRLYLWSQPTYEWVNQKKLNRCFRTRSSGFRRTRSCCCCWDKPSLRATSLLRLSKASSLPLKSNPRSEWLQRVV